MSQASVPFLNAAISTMQTANSTETIRQPLASTLARTVFSLPVLLGILLVAGACLDRYWNLMNASLHQHVYSAYCFEGDMWWHLAVGKWILKNHAWPTHDFYSFTAYGNPWIADQWLGEVLIAVVWGLGQMHALMILLAVLSGGILLLLYYYAWLRSGSVKAAFLACALLLPLASLPFSMRPQILGSAFLVVTLISLERFRQGRPRALWILPPLFMVWVNTHGTFALGFVAMGLYWVAGLREFRLEHLESAAWKPDERRHMAVIFLLCLVACIITPYGTHLAAYPLQMTIFLPMIPQVVPEWHMLDFSRFYGQWFLVLLLVFVTGQLITRLKLQIAELALLVFAAFETIVHARFMLLFVPVFAPLLALLLAQWVDRKRPRREIYALNAILMAVACGAIVFLFPSRARLQQAVDLWNPTGAVRYLREHPVKGRMLNFDDWGGYLIETLGQKVFIDGRADIYEPGGVLLDYLHIYYPQKTTLLLLRKYQIDSFLMPPDAPLATMFATMADWKVAYRDRVSVLYIHAANPNAGIPTEDIRKQVPNNHGKP